MTSLHCPSRSFQHVWVRRSTGGYYTQEHFPLRNHCADHKHISGKPSMLLVPAFRLFRVDPIMPEHHEESFGFSKDAYDERISVGLHEMALYFDPVPDHRAVQNSDLDTLVNEYFQRDPTPSANQLASMAHRYTATMADSHGRTLLEMMARFLDKNGQPNIAEQHSA